MTSISDHKCKIGETEFTLRLDLSAYVDIEAALDQPFDQVLQRLSQSRRIVTVATVFACAAQPAGRYSAADILDTMKAAGLAGYAQAVQAVMEAAVKAAPDQIKPGDEPADDNAQGETEKPDPQ